MRRAKFSIVQEKGQVTIPADLRRRWGLERGTVVTFEETEEGILIRPQKMLPMEALDRLGRLLAERGLRLEDLLTSGRQIREEIAREQYGLGEEGQQETDL